MATQIGGRGRFSLSLLFTSFFGALMVAAAFAYYNHKFSQYNYLDFNKMVLYGQNSVFQPVHEQYGVIVYSSKMGNFDEAVKKIGKELPILAIDIFLEKRQKQDNITFLTAGTNTILKIIHRFAVREVPSIFIIKKVNDKGLYKQDSRVYTL